MTAGMSKSVWYKLLLKGTPSDPNDQTDDVHCPESHSISEFRRLVRAANLNTLEKVDPRLLEVCETGSDAPLRSDKLLSACTSGDAATPFTIRYPGCFLY